MYSFLMESLHLTIKNNQYQAIINTSIQSLETQIGPRGPIRVDLLLVHRQARANDYLD